MNTFIKNLATFFAIALYSTVSLAAPPWASDDEFFQTETPPQAEDVAENSPAMMDDSQEPVAVLPDMSDTELSPMAEADQPAPVAAEPEPVVVTQQKGDVMQMPTASATPVRLLDFPRRGMSTDKVQNELGRPSEIIPAVGEPPISRWVYDDRIVYFERSSVIHVVATR